jgi:Interferon-related developmental regulator (IFRD)
LNEQDLQVDLLESVLFSFGLLYTRTDSPPGKDNFEEIMDKHMELLDGNSIDVRIAAGENLALMLEASETEYDSFGELLQKTVELFKESNKYVAKKDRVSQKLAFRNILESIKGGINPTLGLKFGNQSVTFSGWEKIRQLEFLRNTIKEGLVST